MKFEIDTSKLTEGTALLFGIRYRSDYLEPHPKVFTYVALLAGGRWYMTGTGKVPQDAGWGAVQRWLDDPRREVMWVDTVATVDRLWSAEIGVIDPGRFLSTDVPPSQT